MSRLKRRLDFNLRYLFGNPRWDTGIVPPEVVAFVEKHGPGKALDLGCGTGLNVVFLAQHGWLVTGVDFSRAAVRAARRRVAVSGVNAEILLNDVSSLKSVHGEYNYILDIGCYHNLSQDDRKAYQFNLLRLLTWNGTYMLYGHCQSLDKSPGHGLTESDITELGGVLALRQRVDGLERADRSSVWLWFERTNA